MVSKLVLVAISGGSGRTKYLSDKFATDVLDNGANEHPLDLIVRGAPRRGRATFNGDTMLLKVPPRRAWRTNLEMTGAGVRSRFFLGHARCGSDKFRRSRSKHTSASDAWP
jgi:hypothetical protein